MKCLRNDRKVCIDKIGKVKFGFDFNEECIKYKYLVGERMSKKEWRKIDKYEKYNSRIEWERAIKEKNKGKTKQQLKEFDFYLGNRIAMKSPEKEINIVLCSVVLAELVESICNIVIMNDSIGNVGEVAIAISYILIVLLIMLGVTYCVISPVRSTVFEDTMLKAYRSVIRKMLKKKH